MLRLKAILSLLRYLLVFKKPALSSFDFIDIVIQDKPLFLVSWKTAYAYKVKLKPFNKTHWKKQASLMLKLPCKTEFVEVIISNFWRRTKIKVHLKHTSLDERAAEFLIKKFNPFSYSIQVVRRKWKVAQFDMAMSQKHIHINRPILHIESVKIYPVKKLDIHLDNLKYHK